MKFGHRASRFINFVINDVMPPVLRDSRWLMWPLFRLAFGAEKARLFMAFREQVTQMSDADMAAVYRETASCDLKQTSDLSAPVLERIVARCPQQQAVLDVGCGRGEFLRAMQQRGIPGVGIDLGRDCPQAMSGRYLVGRTEALPLADNSFDTVVCAHVLEHIPDVFAALAELRRVAQRQLVVVLPVERPYRFGFNLHVWFFPYRLNVLQVMRPPAGCQWSLERLGNEWLYIESRS